MAALKHAYQVAILTHEATEIPFEETIADELTQFFVSVGVSLHTSILVDDLESAMGQKRNAEGKKRDRLTLVNYAGYLKECVESAKQFKGQEAEVVIALCHLVPKVSYPAKPAMQHTCVRASTHPDARSE